MYTMDSILDDPAQVRGIIYCVEHIATGKKYVGQTRSHRLNHGRYRPFGAEGRFRDHMSCAICNTKADQCSALYNAVRLHGPSAFKYTQMEECDVPDLDAREKHWIAQLCSIHPNGYNLTDGGRKAMTVTLSVGNTTPQNTPGPRGGSTHRSQVTRDKMSKGVKEALASVEAREKRAQQTTTQHAAAKAARFSGVTIDTTNLTKYIFTKGVVVFVRVDGREASFAGKGNTKEHNIQRAKEFLLSLQPATLPNCSGNP
jgi:hypothetical protein